jgi:hypothetical protein
MGNQFEKLEKLYGTLETLKELGPDLPQNVIEEIQKIEERIISEEIIPLMAQTIEPIIQQIKRELLILIEYKPGENFSIKLTKKRSITIPPEYEKKTNLPKESTYSIPMHGRGPDTDMRVTFLDGSKVIGESAADVFVNTIHKIGLEKVQGLNISRYNSNIVSRKAHPRYSTILKDGYFVLTHFNNETKKRILENISERLNLSLRIIINN